MNNFRLLGWLAVGGLLGAALLAPSAAIATNPGNEGATGSIPVETASVPVETASVPVETASVPVETASVPVETASVPATASHSVPKGSVEAATGTPKEDVTPPSTDTLTPAGSTPSNDGWQLVLIALAALLATALVLTPATRKVRR